MMSAAEEGATVAVASAGSTAKDGVIAGSVELLPSGRGRGGGGGGGRNMLARCPSCFWLAK